MHPNDINANVAEATDIRKQQIEKYNANKKQVSKLLNSYQEQIAKALPKFMSPKVFIQAVMTFMMKKPELMECTPHSLISCVLTSCHLGLIFDDFLGEAYLISFNNTKKRVKEAQFIPGYRGLVTLARRSGQVKSVKAVLVYKQDFFEWEEGLEDKLVHRPQDEKKDEDMVYGYAIIKYINGGYEFNVMTRAEILAIRDESKNYKFAEKKEKTVWATYFPAMCKKTVLRQLMKLAPLSPEIARAVSLDEAADMGMQNLAADMVGDIPEFTEDVEAEIITEQETIREEKKEEVSNAASSRGKAATSATAEKINQKIQPKK